MAPVMMIDDRTYGKLTPDKAVGSIKDFRAVLYGATANGNGSAPVETDAEEETAE